MSYCWCIRLCLPRFGIFQPLAEVFPCHDHLWSHGPHELPGKRSHSKILSNIIECSTRTKQISWFKELSHPFSMGLYWIQFGSEDVCSDNWTCIFWPQTCYPIPYFLPPPSFLSQASWFSCRCTIADNCFFLRDFFLDTEKWTWDLFVSWKCCNLKLCWFISCQTHEVVINLTKWQWKRKSSCSSHLAVQQSTKSCVSF